MSEYVYKSYHDAYKNEYLASRMWGEILNWWLCRDKLTNLSFSFSLRKVFLTQWARQIT